MYCYQTNNDYIDKYKVNIDIAKLTYIYNQLIEKCSFIENIVEEKDKIEEVKSTDSYYIKDYHYKRIKNGKFELSYKKYNKCNLAIIIEKIFRKNINGVYDLFEYNPLSKEELNSIKIKTLSDKIDKIDNINVKDKIHLLNEMQLLLINIENNKNQKEENNFLQDAKKLVKFEFISSIKKDYYEIVNNFFEKELENKNINKTLIKKEK